ncbi:GDSL-type esterase/lipase family protein [Streptomyces sp. NPDC059679]|uniref:GDSL-type esterase/lipase family protein n=1 Tax=Streptomyces sp. NPDC059679 TaxID=3346903 RepID=UPI0036CEB579
MPAAGERRRSRVRLPAARRGRVGTPAPGPARDLAEHRARRRQGDGPRGPWQTDVLDARPDVVSILVGVNDVGWHTLDPQGYVIPAEEFEAGYDRLLAPVAEAGTELILIEPFLLPIHDIIEAGAGAALIGEKERKEWRTHLDPKIQIVRKLARTYGAHLLEADDMFAELAATTAPEYWSADGVHPTPGPATPHSRRPGCAWSRGRASRSAVPACWAQGEPLKSRMSP